MMEEVNNSPRQKNLTYQH